MQQEYMELQGKLLINLWKKLCHQYPGKGEEQTKDWCMLIRTKRTSVLPLHLVWINVFRKELQRASLYSESQIQQGLKIGGL